jgi:aspartate kinase
MKLCKFGGSSLSSAEQIRKVCDIITEDHARKVVVVSAPGKRSSNDTKITDLLIRLAEVILSGKDYQKELYAVVDRFNAIATDLELDSYVVEDVESDLKQRIAGDLTKPERFMDSLKAAGEDNCARLVTAYLCSIGKYAKYLNPQDAGLFLTDEFGNAQVLPESYDNLAAIADLPGIIVFPGFFGYTKSGDVVTFSRGGSDITGSILAAALNVEVYENWTDVDAVYAVNPSLVKNPYAMKEITYDEMRELAYAGFSVLHEEALSPAYKKSIPVHIRNTNNPKAQGTMIVKTRKNFEGMVTGIAGAKGFVDINLSKYLMNREVGFVVKILQIFADEGIPFEHMPSGIDSISVIVKESNLPLEKEERMLRRFNDELAIEKISVNRNLALVMIVGEAMAHTVGVTSRAAGCMSKAGINLEIIDQGASEISVIFGIRDQYCNYAIRELYKEFFLR